MSLYDEAAVALIAEGAAGKDGVLYNIKPEEKLKPTELLENGSFVGSTGWDIPAGDTSFVSVSDGKAVFTDAVANEYRRIRTENDAEGQVFKAGRKYKVSFTVTDFERSADDVNLRAAEVDNKLIILVSGNGNFSKIYTAQADERFQFKVAGGSNSNSTLSCKISNVSIKEVEQAPLDFTFTRGSNLTATRVAPSGYIEKGRENLITYSNDFSEWSAVGGGSPNWNAATTGHSGYDGSTDAWLLDKVTDENSYSAIPNPFAYTGVFTFSIYARNKSDKDNGIHLYTPAGQIKVDLTDGSRISGGHIDYDITPITGSSGDNNRWYRISFSASGSFTVADTPRIKVVDLNGDNDTGAVYVQDAQLEVGLVATEYIESHSTTGKAGILEDSPRFDYLDVTCPHLLMEPTRKNLVPYSEYFGAWTAGNVTVTDNDVKSPEGVVNAAKLLASDDTTAVNHQVDSGDFSIVSGSVTGSVFAKKGNVDFVRLRLNATTAQTRAWFDLENGTVETVDATDSGAFGTIVDMGDGWYRCSVTEPNNTAAQSSAELQIFINESDGQTSWIGDGDEYIYVYGAQVEQAAYATSYIPNHGTSAGVTRNDDVTDTVDFGDYMSGEDITWYVELAKNDTLIRDGSTTGIRLSTTDLNASSVKFYRSYANLANGGIKTVIYFADDENDNDPASHQISEAGPVKVIVRRVKSTGEFTVFYDGAQKYQAFAPANYGKLKSLKIDGENQPLFINNMFLFDRALTDDECIDLTT